jgi:hypothetical protein
MTTAATLLFVSGLPAASSRYAELKQQLQGVSLKPPPAKQFVLSVLHICFGGISLRS